MSAGKKIVLILVLILNSISLLAQISPGKLANAHAQFEGVANCTKCHELGNKVPDSKCLDCHTEIKILINQRKGYHSSSEVKSKTCVECHNDHHGRNFEMIRFSEENFNHNLAGYKLEGRHDRIDCRDCHKPDYIENVDIRKRELTFLGLSHECLSCHDDYHQGTLAEDCLSCHNNFNEFKPAARFDHNQADFKLKGAHQEVDCISCHKKTTRQGKEYQEFKDLKFSSCISCHKDVHQGKFGTNCLECHTEESFQKLRSMNSFNHSRTDFPLEGLHRFVDCKSCHKGNFTKAISFSKCTHCHDDYHKGEFKKNNDSPDCKECHTVNKSFEYTLFGLEEHQLSSFPLDGAHLATPCIDCHVSENHWTFRNIGTKCVDCHQDIHSGQIKEDFYPDFNCTSCHNTGRWNEIAFDHNLTNWKLEGKHKEVSCRECHFENSSDETTEKQNFTALSNNCINCHDNIHGNQFNIDGFTDCSRCHDITENWPANNFIHNNTKFPLDGRHKDIDCRECHKEKVIDGKLSVEYKIESFRCIDCHY